MRAPKKNDASRSPGGATQRYTFISVDDAWRILVCLCTDEGNLINPADAGYFRAWKCVMLTGLINGAVW